MPTIRLPYNYQPRPYQRPLWDYMENGGKRAVAVWHRRAGKDLLSTNWIACASQMRRGLYWHLLPTYEQGKKIVWKGFTKDGRKFLDAFPEELVKSVNQQEMSVEFKNGSIYQVIGTDNVDRLVGTNPIGCVFSEYSLHDPAAWEYIRPILVENDGWAMFIYTPRGYNHGYNLYSMADQNENWFCEKLTIEDTGVMTAADVEAEIAAGMSRQKAQQEFYCSFEAALEHSYYKDQIEELYKQERITSVPYDSNLPVHTFWDLGMDDCTSIWFMQHVGQEFRMIDYFEASGIGLPDYIRELKSRPYVYGEHWAPHDIKVRELGTGKSRWEVAASLGIMFYIIPKIDLMAGIDASRAIIPRCWFDKTKCHSGLEALKQYQKSFDTKTNTYSQKPLHNWASHGADAFRGFAVSFREKLKHYEKPIYAYSEYDMFTHINRGKSYYDNEYDMFAA